MKIKGIKSVDFKVEAKGEGVVNWNGSFDIFNHAAGQKVENHSMPKLRGVDPMRLKSLKSEEINNAKLFISQNCVRNAIFKNETNNLKVVTENNVDRVICSILGLVRGYIITENKLSLKRKSALLLEDFVDENTIIRYEQFSNSGDRNETSIFSKSNVDTTKYEAYGSISIEDLQFIVLEDSFNRSSYTEVITIENGQKIENDMNDFLKSLALGTDKQPEAKFHTNYVRINGITNDGEAGLLLNNDAISLVVEEVLDRIKNLFVRQSKGYFYVNEIIVDYNDGQAMRIKRDLANANSQEKDFAVYYEAKDISEQDFIKKMNELKVKIVERKKKREKELKEKELRQKKQKSVEESGE